MSRYAAHEDESDHDDKTGLTTGRAVASTPHAAMPRTGMCGSSVVIGGIAIALTIAIAVLIIFKTGSSSVSPAAESDAVNTCVTHHQPNTLPQAGLGTKPLGDIPSAQLLKHATIWTGSINEAEAIKDTVDILIVGSVISKVGKSLSAPDGATIVDLNGAIVTPGIVDMHSHAGVYGWPEVWAREDGNEMTDPTTPQVRAIDGYSPQDTAIPIVLGGGVTTSQILPGSGNTMGGEGFIVKMRGTSVRDAYVQGSPRLLKMACGENPKRVYGRGRREMPMSRMGSAWVMRRKFEAASKLVHEQDEWCRNPDHQHDEDHAEDYHPDQDNSPFPSDLSLNSLAALLRGEARLHVHCYETQDLEMVLRMSREFGFNVSAFHHSLQAWRIPDIILESGVTIATFADLTWYKMEAFDASTKSPKVLYDAGVPVALKSDHPVLFAGDLMYEAAKAHYYGLPRHAAIASLTSVPAKAIGMDHRVGRLEAGMDADVVVWDRDPLVLGATPRRVYVNGELLVDRSIPTLTGPSSLRTNIPQLSPAGTTACQRKTLAQGGNSKIAVTGVTVHTQDLTAPNGGVITDAHILVEDGMVKCVGSAVACPVEANSDVYALNGGIVTPGFVESLSHIGQLEIEAESSTQDGYISGAGADGSSAEVMTLDGIRMNTKHVRSAFRAGVTGSVSHPMGSQLVAGLSVAYYTHGDTVGDALIHPHAALHLNVGNHAKNGGVTASIAGQFSALRRLFRAVNVTQEYDSPPNDVIAMVKRRQIKLVVHVDQADAIAATLRFKRHCDCDMVIAGGAEAHVLADKIKAAGVSVVYKARVRPQNFQTLQAVDDGLVRLKAAGVPAALAMGDLDNSRNLRWEAGVAQSLGLTFEQALASITTDVAAIFGLGDSVGRIIAGKKANFVAFDGQPLSLQGRPRLVVLGDYAECDPQQL